MFGLMLFVLDRAIDRRDARTGGAPPPIVILGPRAQGRGARRLEFVGLVMARFVFLPYAIWLFAADLWKGFR